MLVRSLLPPNDKSQASMRVWFGKPVRRTEQDGWIFAQGEAYAAVRPTTGGWRWDSEEPAWMIPDDPHAAIVIQAASRADFPDLAAFEAAVKGRKLKVDAQSVTFAPLGDVGELVLHMGPSDATATQDPKAQPSSFVYRSPFVNAKAGSNQIVVSKSGRKAMLEFATHDADSR
jgi:hypothetical protein